MALLENAEVGDTTMYERIRCPNPACPQPDAVQKVSIVDQNRSSLNQRPVAWQPLPPKAPVNRRRSSGWVLVAMVLFYLFPLGGTAVAIIPFNVLTGRVHLTPDLALRLALTFFIGLVAVGLMVFYLADARRQSARYDTKYAQYWQARARWEQLYSCNQCGSVFNPNEPGRFVPASRMKELLE